MTQQNIDEIKSTTTSMKWINNIKKPELFEELQIINLYILGITIDLKTD